MSEASETLESMQPERATEMTGRDLGALAAKPTCES